MSGADGYLIYRSTSASSGYRQVANVKGQKTVTYTNTGLNAATRYYFKVRSYRTGNDVRIYSGYSSYKYGETPAEVPQISSLSGGNKQITIKWENVSKEDGYEIYRSVYATKSFSREAILTEDKVSYVDKDKSLAQGKKYYYKVRSYRTIGGEKLYSAFGTVEGTATTPAAPAIVSAKAAVTQATVSWKAVSGVSGYDIYVATKSTGTYTKEASVSGSTKTSGVVKDLTAGKKYYFKVKAYISASGEFTTTNSAFSGTKYCTMQKWPAIGVPEMKTYDGAGFYFDRDAGVLSIGWEKVSGATGYEVFQKKGDGEYEMLKEVTTAEQDGSLSCVVSDNALEADSIVKVRAYKTVSGERVYAQDEAAQFGSEIVVKVAAE